MSRYAFVMMFLGAAFAVACSEDGSGGTGGSGGSSTGGAGGTTAGAGGDSMTGGSAGTSGGSGGASAGGAAGTGGSGGTTTAGGSAGTGGAGTGGAAGAGTGGAAGTGTGGAAGTGTGGAAGTGTGGSSGSGGASGAGTGGSSGAGGSADGGGSTTMSFFVTSKGGDNGGAFGGLDGADAFCKTLATAVSAELGQKQWRAYLSTSTVNARDRIGAGPWRNQAGQIIATDLTQLHDQLSDASGLSTTWPIGSTMIALDEKGVALPNDVHDILTGSDAEGRVIAASTCDNWTSAAMTATAQVGHSNRTGGGRPPSWNATHTVGCAPSATNRTPMTVTSGGGRGSIYCFALP